MEIMNTKKNRSLRSRSKPHSPCTYYDRGSEYHYRLLSLVNFRRLRISSWKSMLCSSTLNNSFTWIFSAIWEMIVYALYQSSNYLQVWFFHWEIHIWPFLRPWVVRVLCEYNVNHTHTHAYIHYTYVECYNAPYENIMAKKRKTF